MTKKRQKGFQKFMSVVLTTAMLFVALPQTAVFADGENLGEGNTVVEQVTPGDQPTGGQPEAGQPEAGQDTDVVNPDETPEGGDSVTGDENDIMTLEEPMVRATSTADASNYNDLVTAISSVDAGGTITLTDDIAIPANGSQFSITENITIDGANNSITFTEKGGFSVSAGLTLKDVTLINSTTNPSVDSWTVSMSAAGSLKLEGTVKLGGHQIQCPVGATIDTSEVTSLSNFGKIDAKNFANAKKVSAKMDFSKITTPTGGLVAYPFGNEVLIKKNGIINTDFNGTDGWHSSQVDGGIEAGPASTYLSGAALTTVGKNSRVVELNGAISDDAGAIYQYAKLEPGKEYTLSYIHAGRNYGTAQEMAVLVGNRSVLDEFDGKPNSANLRALYQRTLSREVITDVVAKATTANVNTATPLTFKFTPEGNGEIFVAFVSLNGQGTGLGNILSFGNAGDNALGNGGVSDYAARMTKSTFSSFTVTGTSNVTINGVTAYLDGNNLYFTTLSDAISVIENAPNSTTTPNNDNKYATGENCTIDVLRDCTVDYSEDNKGAITFGDTNTNKKSLTINGNNHKITRIGTGTNGRLFDFGGSKKYTIKDAKLEINGGAASPIQVSGTAEVTLDNVTLNSQNDTKSRGGVHINGGTAILTNGTRVYANGGTEIAANVAGGTLQIEDCEIIASNGASGVSYTKGTINLNTKEGKKTVVKGGGGIHSINTYQDDTNADKVVTVLSTAEAPSANSYIEFGATKTTEVGTTLDGKPTTVYDATAKATLMNELIKISAVKVTGDADKGTYEVTAGTNDGVDLTKYLVINTDKKVKSKATVDLNTSNLSVVESTPNNDGTQKIMAYQLPGAIVESTDGKTTALSIQVEGGYFKLPSDNIGDLGFHGLDKNGVYTNVWRASGEYTYALFIGDMPTSNNQKYVRGVTFYTNGGKQTVTVKAEIFDIEDAEVIPFGDSYYKRMDNTKTWTGAYAAAKETNVNELKGYLATITSQAEHNFVYQAFGGYRGWTGGTRYTSTIYDNDSSKLDQDTYPIGKGTGNWIWACGPEVLDSAKRLISNGYSNWTPGEPNGGTGTTGPGFMQYGYGTGGKWDDLPETAKLGSYVEYTDYANGQAGDYKDKHQAPGKDTRVISAEGNVKVEVNGGQSQYFTSISDAFIYANKLADTNITITLLSNSISESKTVTVNAGKKITLTSKTGKGVVDGAVANGLITVNGDLTVKGIKLKNSKGNGISTGANANVTISDNGVVDAQAHGIHIPNADVKVTVNGDGASVTGKTDGIHVEKTDTTGIVITLLKGAVTATNSDRLAVRVPGNKTTKVIIDPGKVILNGGADRAEMSLTNDDVSFILADNATAGDRKIRIELNYTPTTPPTAWNDTTFDDEVFNGKASRNSTAWVVIPDYQLNKLAENVEFASFNGYAHTGNAKNVNVDDGLPIVMAKKGTNTVVTAAYAVAQISSTTYRTVAAAIGKVATSETIELLRDYNLSVGAAITKDITEDKNATTPIYKELDKITAPSGKTVILKSLDWNDNGNGGMPSSATDRFRTLTTNASGDFITVKDASSATKLTVQDINLARPSAAAESNDKRNIFAVGTNGTLNVDDNVKATSGYLIATMTGGEMTVNGADTTLTASNHSGILVNGGTFTLTDSTITSGYGTAVNVGANATATFSSGKIGGACTNSINVADKGNNPNKFTVTIKPDTLVLEKRILLDTGALETGAYNNGGNPFHYTTNSIKYDASATVDSLKNYTVALQGEGVKKYLEALSSGGVNGVDNKYFISIFNKDTGSNSASSDVVKKISVSGGYAAIVSTSSDGGLNNAGIKDTETIILAAKNVIQYIDQTTNQPVQFADFKTGWDAAMAYSEANPGSATSVELLVPIDYCDYEIDTANQEGGYVLDDESYEPKQDKSKALEIPAGANVKLSGAANARLSLQGRMNIFGDLTIDDVDSSSDSVLTDNTNVYLATGKSITNASGTVPKLVVEMQTPTEGAEVIKTQTNLNNGDEAKVEPDEKGQDFTPAVSGQNIVVDTMYQVTLKSSILKSEDSKHTNAAFSSYTYDETTIEGPSKNIKTVAISLDGKGKIIMDAVDTLGTFSGWTTLAADDNLVVLTSATVATVSAVEAAIRAVEFTVAVGTNKVSVNVSSNEMKGEFAYNPANGHFYQYVNTAPSTWMDAQKDANKTVFMGSKGYLATVTDKSEDDFLKANLNGTGWIGLSSADGRLKDANGNAIDGWSWQTGPEKGTLVYKGLNWTDDTNKVGWSDINPYFNGNGTVAQFGYLGKWDDVGTKTTSTNNYYIEYGGMDKNLNTRTNSTSSLDVDTATFDSYYPTPSRPSSGSGYTGPTITVKLGKGGQILPEGVKNGTYNVQVAKGEDAKFSIIPDKGYMTYAVFIDNVRLDKPLSEYTFENVTEDHTIEAYFAPDDGSSQKPVEPTPPSKVPQTSTASLIRLI